MNSLWQHPYFLDSSLALCKQCVHDRQESDKNLLFPLSDPYDGHNTRSLHDKCGISVEEHKMLDFLSGSHQCTVIHYLVL